MVIGEYTKKKKISGLSLLEALVATVIVGIGFVAIFQMVQYAGVSIDSSTEKNKANYLIGLVLEDVIADKDTEITNSGGVKQKFFLRLQEEGGWEMTTCDEHQNTIAHNNVYNNKDEKWQNRLSQRIKCKGNADIKRLSIIDICRNGAGFGTSGNCTLEKTDFYEPRYFGRMEILLNDGNHRKFTYFQIE